MYFYHLIALKAECFYSEIVISQFSIRIGGKYAEKVQLISNTFLNTVCLLIELLFCCMINSQLTSFSGRSMKRKIISSTGILLLVLLIIQLFPIFNNTHLVQTSPITPPTNKNTSIPYGGINSFPEQFLDPNLFQSVLQTQIPFENEPQNNILFFQSNSTQTPYAENSIISVDLIGNPHSIQTPFYFLPSKTPTTLPTLNVTGLYPIPDSKRGLLTNGNRSVLMVALTFDVCQSENDTTSSYDSGIVKILNDTQTPATFFLGGLWITDHQENAKSLAQNPLFELGSHSWSHVDLSKADTEKILSEINLAQIELFTLTGKQNYLFRLPFGYYTDEALEIIADNGLYTIQWDVISGDPDPNMNAESMQEWVLRQVKPGSIIIMHANGRGYHTAEALPTIIKSLKNEGYTFATISDLLNLTHESK